MGFIKGKFSFVIVLLINIVVFAFVFILSEYICYKKLLESFPATHLSFRLPHIYNSDDINKFFLSKLDETDYFQFKDFEKQSDKSIILFGGSVAYGENKNSDNLVLADEDTISYKLSQALNLSVYNRAIPGCGLNEILYQLKHPFLLKNITKEPEYIIYIYMPDHIRRMLMPCNPITKQYFLTYYKLQKNNTLKERKYWFLKELYSYNLFMYNRIFAWQDNTAVKKQLYSYFQAYLNEINSEIKKIYPNTKFVIIIYSSLYDFEDEIMSEYNVIDIPKLTGIDIMNSNEELEKKYIADSFFHPNGDYWNMVLPVIVEKLNEF